MQKQQIARNLSHPPLPSRTLNNQSQPMHNLNQTKTPIKKIISKHEQQREQKLQRYLLKDYSFLHDYIIVDTENYQSNTYSHINNTLSNYNSNKICKEQENAEIFVAQIMGTEQLVRFNKIPYSDALIDRFQALVSLYQQGVVLADNLFILDEADKLYFYIIQAYIPDTLHIENNANNKQYPSTATKRNQQSAKTCSNPNISVLSAISPPTSRFITLKQYINSPSYSQDIQKNMKMIDKLKILIDCVHQTGQAYIGLTPNHIIIDLQDEQSMYLAPYILHPEISISTNNANLIAYRQIMAYFSPQVLNMERTKQQSQKSQNRKNKQMEQKQIKINNQILVKNDIWSFGCIILEILFYCTPVFMAINNTNQIILISQFITNVEKDQQFSINWCLSQLNHQCQQSYSFTNEQLETNRNSNLKNLIQNTLQMQSNKRILTSQRNNINEQMKTKTKTKMKDRKQNKGEQFNKFNFNNCDNETDRYEQQLSHRNRNQTQISSPIHAIRNKKSNMQDWSITPTPITQNTNIMNKNKNKSAAVLHQNGGDHELQLHFLYISNIQIQKQLRINVYLDKKYSIFVSPNLNNSSKIIKINKAISMIGSQSDIAKVLDSLITVELKQKQNKQGNHICINLNLSTLALVDSGRRIWDKPLIGSYYPNGTYGVDKPSIKIKAELIKLGKSASSNEDSLCNILKQNKMLINDQELRKTISQRRKCYEEVKIKREKQKEQKIKEMDKQNKLKIIEENKIKIKENKKDTIFQPNNYFMNINKNLQLICQKWRSNTKSKEKQDPKEKQIQQNKQDELQMPVSLSPSRQTDSSMIKNKKDEQIDNKIKSILKKLDIFHYNI